jgi:hypothetical protein
MWQRATVAIHRGGINGPRRCELAKLIANRRQDGVRDFGIFDFAFWRQGRMKEMALLRRIAHKPEA